MTLSPAIHAAAAEPLSEADLDRRIDHLRRADFTVTVLTPEGMPATGEAGFDLDRHAFEFGTAISSSMVGGPEPIGAGRSLPTDEDRLRYEQIVTEYFSAVVVENAMKWPLMEDADGRDPGKEARALYIYDWAADRGLPMRGHNLIWGVRSWRPDWQKDLLQEPAEVIEARIKARFQRALELFDGYIHEWDLNNEMMHGDAFGEALGLDTGAAYFDWAHAIDPDVAYYVNEYGILQGDQVDDYVQHIRDLLNAGAKIGGIGDQAHFSTPLPGNAELWAILDKLGQFGLPVKITEFDLHYKGMTDQEQAEQLRRFYRVCFAHPAVAGIYMWGFYENAHWRKDAALWRTDWTPRPAAEAYMRLIDTEWHTQGQAALDSGGLLRFRGFPGTYRITLGEHTATVTLTRDQPAATVQPAPASSDE